MKYKTILKFSILFTMLTSVGCAGRAPLNDYPRAEIDRPYTLPNGVTNWHIPMIFSYSKNLSSESSIDPIVLPLLWETSLSDDWNLIFEPLPLGVSHQFFKDDENRLGFSLNTGFSYSDRTGFRLKPSLTFGFRHRFTESFAIDLTPSITPNIAFKTGEANAWSSSITLAPLFQLSETFSVSPDVSAYWFHQTVYSIDFVNGMNLEEQHTNALFGVGISTTYSFARQWDFRAQYHYAGSGNPDGIQSQFGVIEFVHFW